MAKCTGKRCPMQVGFKVDECNYKECPYRTEPITNADYIREGMAKQYLEPDGRISPIYFSDCDGWCVSCEECGYETNHFTKPEIAIEAWNRRAVEEDKHETD